MFGESCFFCLLIYLKPNDWDSNLRRPTANLHNTHGRGVFSQKNWPFRNADVRNWNITLLHSHSSLGIFHGFVVTQFYTKTSIYFLLYFMVNKVKFISLILLSVLRYVRSIFLSEVSTESNLVPSPSIYSILSFPQVHPVATYVFFLLFLSLTC
jgi:hypothetical protein